MRVRLDIDKVYQELSKSIVASPQDAFFLEATKQLREGDNWKEEAGVIVPSESEYVRLAPTLLPSPFKNMGGGFKKKDGSFKGEIGLYFGNYYDPESGSDEIIKRMYQRIVEGLGNDWAQMSPDSGYLLKNGRPLIAVCQESGGVTNIGLGNRGTTRRKFGSYEEFSNDLISLEQIINLCVNLGIESAISEGRQKQNPEIEVYLRPQIQPA